MSPHSSRESSSHEPAPRLSVSHLSGHRLSTAHAVTSPTARFRKPAQPLAARQTNTAPRFRWLRCCGAFLCSEKNREFQHSFLVVRNKGSTSILCGAGAPNMKTGFDVGTLGKYLR